MRVAAYTDYVYHRVDGAVHAERAFALFLAALGRHCDRLVLIGRMGYGHGSRYELPADVELLALPYYDSLAKPLPALISATRSVRHLWRGLADVDLVWVLGPYPHALLLVLVALVRRRTVVLGVRQDWPRYVRARRPGRRWMHLAADTMEWLWRALARRLPTVVVGPELAQAYARAPALLELTVSMIPASAVLDQPPERDYESELRVLSVGRLEEEKNPLLLADILAALRAQDPRWRLVVCGEGELEGQLRDRLRRLAVEDQAELLGYVPMGEGLMRLYRECHALLHVSWTEGFPQVLIEAFAAGLPIVATAVGGVQAGVGDAALIIRPGSATDAVAALRRTAADPALRERLAWAGLQRARELTMEAQVDRLAEFLAGQARAARSLRARS